MRCSDRAAAELAARQEIRDRTYSDEFTLQRHVASHHGEPGQDGIMTTRKARSVVEGQMIVVDGREWPVTAVEFLGPIVRIRSGRRVFRFQGHKTVETVG